MPSRPLAGSDVFFRSATPSVGGCHEPARLGLSRCSPPGCRHAPESRRQRQDEDAKRPPRSTPEAAYSVSQAVGAERPLPHSRSEGPRCMYSCMRTNCMCLCRTLPHVNGCLLCACPWTTPVSSVLPSFLNDIGKKAIESWKPKKGPPRAKRRPAGSNSLRSSLAPRFRRSRSLPDRARKTAPSSGSSQPKSSCEAG